MGYYTQLSRRHGLGVGQVLLTVDDVTRRGHYRNAYRTFGRLLELGVMPIVNENDTVATHEIRFGDNDRLAALVAHLVHADALILLSDVDALYTGHPNLPGPRRITDVYADEDLAGVDISTRGSGVGTGGMITKVDAARIATSAGIPIVLTSAVQAAEASAASRSAPSSTRPASVDRPGCCGSATPPMRAASWCSTTVRSARWSRHASLLPAGVTAVERPVHRRRGGRPRRPGGARGGPGAGQLRRRRDPGAARARPPARSPPNAAAATTVRWCTRTPSSCMDRCGATATERRY